MKTRIGINGFGRIGRSVFRVLNSRDDIEIVAINDIFDKEALTYLLKYDTVMGPFKDSVEINGDILKTSYNEIKMLAEKDPNQLPWGEMGVDVVIESTGIFRTKNELEQHLRSGAKKVILTVPSKDEIDYTLVIGVNDGGLTDEHKIISNASCTTNCLAPIAYVLNKEFKIEKGFMTTIHSYTTDQRMLDNSHKDPRRARSAGQSIVPTSTGASKAIGEIIPSLKGKLEGIAMRVPTPNVSLVELVFQTKKDLSIEKINSSFNKFSKNNKNKVLKITQEKLVSVDFNHDPASSIIDAKLTNVVGKNMGKISAWYDNEWGFSNRMCDLAEYLLSLIHI